MLIIHSTKISIHNSFVKWDDEELFRNNWTKALECWESSFVSITVLCSHISNLSSSTGKKRMRPTTHPRELASIHTGLSSLTYLTLSELSKQSFFFQMYLCKSVHFPHYGKSKEQYYISLLVTSAVSWLLLLSSHCWDKYLTAK